jgi:hypothetical protein
VVVAVTCRAAYLKRLWRLASVDAPPPWPAECIFAFDGCKPR